MQATLHFLRRSIPWLVGGVVLAALFARVSPNATLAALGNARLELFLPLVFGATLVWFVLDAAVYRYLFSRFNVRLSRGEARALRGLSYLLTPLHWNLGRAALVARVHQRHGVPLLEAASTVLVYQVLDAILLATLALIGALALPAQPETRILLASMAALVGVGCTYLVWLARAEPEREQSLRPSRPGRLQRSTEWIRTAALHRSHRQLRMRDVGFVWTAKLGYYGVLIFVYWAGSRCFDVFLDAARVTASVPIIQGVGALPISPAGFGTQQATMLYLFRDAPSQGSTGIGLVETEAAIVAFGLALPVLTILCRCLIGGVYLRTLGREDAPNAISRSPSL